MRGGFPPEFIERVLDATDVLKIIGRYTSLKKAGKNYIGLCPFHQEKTPSFSVDVDRGLFYCFGCGKGGNIFTFLVEKEGMSFPEAVKFLADESGVPIPERRISYSQTKSLVDALEIAHKFYKDNLWSVDGRSGREYLIQRGITDAWAKKIELGWVDARWDSLVSFLRKKNIDINPFVKVGLVMQKGQLGNDNAKISESYYDRFRGGIIFPIKNSGGRLVGFAIRVLEPGEGPKYINSPDSLIYHKSDTLFGLNFSRGSIRSRGYSVLVEGYFDAISLWIAGIENTVAVCGTAFTSSHANILSRFAPKIVLFFDGDDAGLSAVYRALPLCLSQNLITAIARPPENMDPDDIARKWESERILKLLENAPDWLVFSIKLAHSKGMLESIEGKLRFVDKMAPYLSVIEDPLAKSLYIQQLAREIGITENNVERRCAKTKLERRSSREYEGLSKEAQRELLALAMLVHSPKLLERMPENLPFVQYAGAFDELRSEILNPNSSPLLKLAEVLEPRANAFIARTLIELDEKISSKKDLDPGEKILAEEWDSLMKKLAKTKIDHEINKLKNLLVDADQQTAREILGKIAKLKGSLIQYGK